MPLNDIARLRLCNQGIARPGFTEAAQVVAWLGAMQAQDYTGALWSVGLRMAQVTEHTVEQAIAARTIVRTWPMRGTLHFVTAQDVRWLLALLTPRQIAQSAGRYRQLALNDATFARSQAVFAQALQGGKQLTRAELLQHLEQANIATAGQRGYHLLGRAAQDGVICFGVPRGKQQTFVLLDEWVPPTTALTRAEALTGLAQRYFTSHGPATLQDLVRWAGITVKDARQGIADAGDALIQATVADQIYWLPHHMPDTTAAASLHLLPGFDEYILGYGDRTAMLDPAYAQRICPGGNGVFRPTVVIEGVVAGTWQRTIKTQGKKKGVQLEWTPFQAFTTAEEALLAVAAQQYAQFLEMPMNGHEVSRWQT
ncbi:MAG: winged helix DNA-binding domain-containing protein [Caldilineaceae bacterium]